MLRCKKKNIITFFFLKSDIVFLTAIMEFVYKNGYVGFNNSFIFVNLSHYVRIFTRFKFAYYSKGGGEYYFYIYSKFIKNVYNILNKFLSTGFPFYMHAVNVIGLNLKLLLKIQSLYYLFDKAGIRVKLKKFMFIRLDLGFSHYLDLKIPDGVFVRRRKRHFLFFGVSPGTLRKFLLFLTNVKAVTAYKLRGYPIVGYPHAFKEGKKLFR